MSTFGYAELDFEPVDGREVTSIEFACDVRGCVELANALAEGVLIELAGGGVRDPDGRRGDPILARVVIRAIRFHDADSCEPVYCGLGVLAVREMLACVAEDRVPRPVITTVSVGYRP